MIASILSLLVLQAPDQAPRTGPLDGGWIIRHFGQGKPLTPEGFKAFVAEELSGQLDSGGDWPEETPRLDSDELTQAWLHLEPTQESFPDEYFRTYSQEALLASAGVLAGNHDVSWEALAVSAYWSKLLDAVTRRQEQLLAQVVGKSDSYGPEQLDQYLRIRKQPARSAAQRKVRLSALADASGEIGRDDLGYYSWGEALAEADSDGSGKIDSREFRGAFLGKGAGTEAELHAAFLALADDAHEIPCATTRPVAGASAVLAAWTDQRALELWKRATFDPSGARVSFEAFVDVLEEDERKQKDKQKPSRFLPGDGLLLFPAPISIDEKVTFDTTKGSLWFRLVQDHKAPAASAKPATISWARDDDVRSSNLDFSAALLYRGSVTAASHWEFTGAVRMQRATQSDATPERKLDKREFFLGATHVRAGNGATLRGGRLRIAGLHENDEVAEVTRDALALDWFPSLGQGALRSGWWNSYSSQGAVQAYYLPSIGVELSDYDIPSGSEVDEVPSHLRLELGLGLKLFEVVTAQVDLKGRTDLDEEYGFFNGTLSVPLGKENVVLTLSAKHGRDTPSFERDERYEIGIGVKL